MMKYKVDVLPRSIFDNQIMVAIWETEILSWNEPAPIFTYFLIHKQVLIFKAWFNEINW